MDHRNFFLAALGELRTMREGDTPLVDAARHGRAADVAALLADGADVNEPMTNGSGVTALHLSLIHISEPTRPY